MTDPKDAFGSAVRRLQDSLNEDPFDAIRSARALAVDGVDQDHIDFARAAIFIDAGALVGAPGVVREGTEVLRRLMASGPDRFDIAYNLANGLVAAANLDVAPRLEWFLRTRAERREARVLYDKCAAEPSDTGREVASQALCNLGNSLRKASRWCEAYDVFVRALRVHPKNGVAAGNAAELLRFMARHEVDDARLLWELSKRYAGIAQRERETVVAFAGPAAAGRFDQLSASSEPPDLRPPTLPAYEEWVAVHGLPLCPTVEGVDWQSRRWDSVHLRSISEPIDSDAGVPPPFAMFNGLKADYLIARDLAFEAHVEEEQQDTGLYFDTLDYAIYGRRAAKATLAQRAALDLLDRVGVFVNEYLRLGQDVRRVKFRSVWTDNPDTPRSWLPQIHDALAEDPYLLTNEGQSLLALAELAADIGHEGFLKPHVDTRNASTHRFTVLHDLALHEPRESAAIVHRELAAFLEETVKALQVARAALLYLADFVNTREARQARLRMTLPSLHVPTHDYIRGTGDAWRPKGTDPDDPDSSV